jgi:hypothetical protein
MPSNNQRIGRFAGKYFIPLLLGLALLGVVGWHFCANYSNAPEQSSNTVAPSAHINVADTTPDIPASPWAYRESTDDMTGKTINFACTTSPDRGGSELCFRRKNGELNAYLRLPETLEGGQFLCYEDHCSTQIKVDSKAPYSVEGEEETSGNTRVMFLPNAASLLIRTKGAQRILVEATFYSEGHQTLHFDVSGLDF